MSIKPSDREPVSGHEEEKKQQQHHRQGESLGQKRDQTSPKKKKTVQFDEGQKFTSDEDIKRRTA
jgi:hypothetical protein